MNVKKSEGTGQVATVLEQDAPLDWTEYSRPEYQVTGVVWCRETGQARPMHSDKCELCLRLTRCRQYDQFIDRLVEVEELKDSGR